MKRLVEEPEQKCGADGSDLDTQILESKKTEFLDAVLVNDIEKVGYYLDDYEINPADENNLALRCACEEGHTRMVRLLLTDPRVHPMQEIENPDDNDDVVDPLVLACQHGRLDIVELLLCDPRVHPGEYDNLAIQKAIYGNYADIVKLLLNDPRVDPAKGDLLFHAVQGGHAEVVKVLLADWRISLELSISKLANDTSDIPSLICFAADENYLEVLEILLTHPKTQASLEATNPEYSQLKTALNCNRYGLFSEIVKSNKLESRLCKFAVKNLAEEVADAFNTSMKK